jgi:hypothetical protein
MSTDPLKLSLNDYVENIYRNREKILEAFIAETGLKPSECEQVEICGNNGFRFYVKKREPDNLRQPEIAETWIKKVEMLPPQRDLFEDIKRDVVIIMDIQGEWVRYKPRIDQRYPASFTEPISEFIRRYEPQNRKIELKNENLN